MKKEIVSSGKRVVSAVEMTLTSDYVSDISNILHQARNYVKNSVNTAMVQAYWLIGKRIVMQEQSGKDRAEYGKQIIENLSSVLTKEFGKSNLWSFKQFYLTFPILHSLRGELSWTHYRMLLHVENWNAYPTRCWADGYVCSPL